MGYEQKARVVRACLRLVLVGERGGGGGGVSMRGTMTKRLGGWGVTVLLLFFNFAGFL